MRSALLLARLFRYRPPQTSEHTNEQDAAQPPAKQDGARPLLRSKLLLPPRCRLTGPIHPPRPRLAPLPDAGLISLIHRLHNADCRRASIRRPRALQDVARFRREQLAAVLASCCVGCAACASNFAGSFGSAIVPNGAACWQVSNSGRAASIIAPLFSDFPSVMLARLLGPGHPEFLCPAAPAAASRA